MHKRKIDEFKYTPQGLVGISRADDDHEIFDPEIAFKETRTHVSEALITYIRKKNILNRCKIRVH